MLKIISFTPLLIQATQKIATLLLGPLPISFDLKRTYLLSNVISNHTLKSVDQILRENNRYMDSLVKKNIGTLCQALAKDTNFGNRYPDTVYSWRKVFSFYF